MQFANSAWCGIGHPTFILPQIPKFAFDRTSNNVSRMDDLEIGRGHTDTAKGDVKMRRAIGHFPIDDDGVYAVATQKACRQFSLRQRRKPRDF